MGRFEELTDFSMYEGSAPCPLCKGEASKTLMGEHWKCSKCAHIFNADGSGVDVQCLCDKCMAKTEKEHAKQNKEFLKALKKASKEAKKKKTE